MLVFENKAVSVWLNKDIQPIDAIKVGITWWYTYLCKCGGLLITYETFEKQPVCVECKGKQK